LHGRSLDVIGFTHRAGRLHLILVLPDGTRSLFRDTWTDLEARLGKPPPAAAAIRPGSPTLGSLSDLLRARIVVDALLRRFACCNGAQGPSAQEEGVDATVIAERYIEADERDMAALGVERPDVAPRATQHIGEMPALIERLLTTGHAYIVDGDVYFEIARFPRYGRLSGKNVDELLAGARVEVRACGS
jgi:hypothetical protein